jgi:alpha-L-fucosidase
MLDSESEEQWENCRGIGLSFGYNRVEGPEHCLDGPGIARHLADVVSRGGHFLLNIGPQADGTIPENQLAALTEMGRWMQVAKPLLVGAQPAPATPEAAGDGWARALRTDGGDDVCFVDLPGGGAEPVVVTGWARPGGSVTSAEPSWGTVTVRDDGALVVEPAAGRPGPVVLQQA